MESTKEKYKCPTCPRIIGNPGCTCKCMIYPEDIKQEIRDEYKHGKTDGKAEMQNEIETSKKLIAILSNFAGEKGDNEGAVETLERLVKELKELRKKGEDN